MMTQCLPAGIFTLAGAYQMTVWALGKHRNYRNEFKVNNPELTQTQLCNGLPLNIALCMSKSLYSGNIIKRLMNIGLGFIKRITAFLFASQIK